MSGSSSIFDGLTVSAPSLQGSGKADGGATDVSQPPLSAGLTASAAAGAPAVVASTGLVALVSGSEIQRLVRGAARPLVLVVTVRKPVERSKQPAFTQSYRYAFPCAGIVFIATTGERLGFQTGTREVACETVLHDGKPL